MKKAFFTFALCTALFTLFAADTPQPAPQKQTLQPVSEKISVTADKTEAECGEKSLF